MTENSAPSDRGLAAWLQANISDARVRLALLVMLFLTLIGNLVIRYLGGIGVVFETIAIEVVFVYAALVIIATSVAIFPVGDQDTPAKVAAASRAQRNARGSLFLLLCGGVVLVLVADILVLPVWPALRFEFQFSRLRWGAIDLATFFDGSPVSDSVPNETVLDLSEAEIPFAHGRVTDLRAFLRLIGKQDHFTVPGSLDLRRQHSMAVIAARTVEFNEFSSILLGSSNLIILTDHLVLCQQSPHCGAVLAYEKEDVPSNIGLPPAHTGRSGLNAGSVTIVVLDKIEGAGILEIDLRGQKGGQGAKGIQPAPKANAESPQPQPGRPNWSFRKPTAVEVKASHDRFNEELANVVGDQARTDEIKKFRAQFDQCVSSGACKFMLCDDPEWKSIANAKGGADGESGGKGGQGGDGGYPGALAFFVRSGAPDLSKEIGDHIYWLDGASIVTKPPLQLRAVGGPPGDGGLPGAGGIGLLGDVVGACKGGDNGATGKPPPPGKDGELGAQPKGGEPALVDNLTDFL